MTRRPARWFLIAALTLTATVALILTTAITAT